MSQLSIFISRCFWEAWKRNQNTNKYSASKESKGWETTAWYVICFLNSITHLSLWEKWGGRKFRRRRRHSPESDTLSGGWPSLIQWQQGDSSSFGHSKHQQRRFDPIFTIALKLSRCFCFLAVALFARVVFQKTLKITKPADSSLWSKEDKSSNLFAVSEVFWLQDNQVSLNCFVEGITLEETQSATSEEGQMIIMIGLS